MKNIIFPEVLSNLQQEFKLFHYKLSHIHPKSMFMLEKLEVLPSIFIDLKDNVRLCEPCMFGTASRRRWIPKGKE